MNVSFVYSTYLLLGIVCAMEASLDYLKMGTVEGKSVVLQGAGNVGKLSIYNAFRLKILVLR